jgi:hypothetical protein
MAHERQLLLAANSKEGPYTTRLKNCLLGAALPIWVAPGHSGTPEMASLLYRPYKTSIDSRSFQSVELLNFLSSQQKILQNISPESITGSNIRHTMSRAAMLRVRPAFHGPDASFDCRCSLCGQRYDVHPSPGPADIPFLLCTSGVHLCGFCCNKVGITTPCYLAALFN